MWFRKKKKTYKEESQETIRNRYVNDTIQAGVRLLLKDPERWTRVSSDFKVTYEHDSDDIWISTETKFTPLSIYDERTITVKTELGLHSVFMSAKTEAAFREMVAKQVELRANEATNVIGKNLLRA